MATRNVLFYSKQCSLSRQILNILNQEQFINFFVLFCVDGRLHEVPKGITHVPTMIVNGIDKPLVANDIMGWINNMKFLKYNNPNNNQQQKKDRLPGYTESEMNSISDSFAYTDKDSFLPQKYSGIGTEHMDPIITFPEFDKIKKDEFKKTINNENKSRKDQENTFSEHNKNLRINALRNYKYNSS